MVDEQRANILRKRSEVLAIALLGKETAEKWWNGRNKAFDMKTPNEMWEEDCEKVYAYLMQASSGGYW